MYARSMPTVTRVPPHSVYKLTYSGKFAWHQQRTIGNAVLQACMLQYSNDLKVLTVTPLSRQKERHMPKQCGPRGPVLAVWPLSDATTVPRLTIQPRNPQGPPVHTNLPGATCAHQPDTNHMVPAVNLLCRDPNSWIISDGCHTRL